MRRLIIVQNLKFRNTLYRKGDAVSRLPEILGWILHSRDSHAPVRVTMSPPGVRMVHPRMAKGRHPLLNYARLYELGKSAGVTASLRFL